MRGPPGNDANPSHGSKAKRDAKKTAQQLSLRILVAAHTNVAVDRVLQSLQVCGTAYIT